MKIQLPIIFSQFNPEWKDKLLGYNTEPEYNFYNYGCLVSSFAMIARYYGRAVDPSSLNDLLKADNIKGFVNGGEYFNGKFSQLFPEIQETSVPTAEELTDAQMGEIKSALDQGFPVIFGIDYNPTTIKFDSHFVVVVDYNPNDENDFTIADPLGGRLHSLKDYLSNKVNSARKSVWKYFILKGNVPQVTTPQPQAPQPAPVVTQPEPAPVAALPSNYNDIVHGSSQWDEVVKEYAPEVMPKSTVFKTDQEGVHNIKAIIDAQVKTVEKIVEVEVVKEVPVNSSEPSALFESWKNTVEYLEVKKPLSEVSFEDVKRVVAGIKSRETTAVNQATEWEKKATLVATENKNLKEEISSLKKEMLQNAKLEKAKLDALKQSTPNFDKLTRQFETIISEVKETSQERLNELSNLRIEVAVKTVDEKQTGEVVKTDHSASLPGSALVNLFKRFFTLRW